MSGPTHRTITVVDAEPWLLGWCRWEIATDIHYEGGGRVRIGLAAGRWKWRGRNAKLVEATIGADLYWAGPPIQGPPPPTSGPPAQPEGGLTEEELASRVASLERRLAAAEEALEEARTDLRGRAAALQAGGAGALAAGLDADVELLSQALAAIRGSDGGT